MNKQEFLTKLRKGLAGLPNDDIEERVAFYSEMIDDRLEEGNTEEEVLREIGGVDEIVSQIISNTPLVKLVKEKAKPKRNLKVWEMILLIAGSPLWVSLLLAVIAVILAIYISLWSVIISLWAVFGSVLACGISGVVAGVGFAVQTNVNTGLVMIGAGLVCLGLAIFMFYGCKAATKGIMLLTKKFALWIKSCFIKKEAV